MSSLQLMPLKCCLPVGHNRYMEGDNGNTEEKTRLEILLFCQTLKSICPSCLSMGIPFCRTKLLVDISPISMFSFYAWIAVCQMSKIGWNWWEVSDKKLFFAFLKKTTFLKVELNLEEHSKGPIMALSCFQNKVAKYNPVEIVWSHVWNSPPARPSMGQWVIVLITICYLLLHRQSPLRRILYLLQEYCHRPWLSSIGDLSRVLFFVTVWPDSTSKKLPNGDKLPNPVLLPDRQCFLLYIASWYCRCRWKRRKNEFKNFIFTNSQNILILFNWTFYFSLIKLLILLQVRLAREIVFSLSRC